MSNEIKKLGLDSVCNVNENVETSRSPKAQGLDSVCNVNVALLVV